MKQEEWDYSVDGVASSSYENDGWLFNDSATIMGGFDYSRGKLGFDSSSSGGEYICTGGADEYSSYGKEIRRSSTFGVSRRSTSDLSSKRRKQNGSSPSWSLSSRRSCKGVPISSFSSSLSRFTLPDENGKRKIRHDIMSIAESLPSLPGLYFDKKQKGFRVRYQNVYVGWVALSRFPSIEEAYISARDIWENAKLHAEKYQTPHAAIMASLPLQQEAQASGKNRGGRPRTVTQLPPNPTDWLNNAIMAPSPNSWQPNNSQQEYSNELEPFVSQYVVHNDDPNECQLTEETTNYWTHHSNLAAMFAVKQPENDNIYHLAGSFDHLDYGAGPPPPPILDNKSKNYYPNDDHLGLVTVGPGAISYSQPVTEHNYLHLKQDEPITPPTNNNHHLQLDSTALPTSA